LECFIKHPHKLLYSLVFNDLIEDLLNRGADYSYTKTIMQPLL
jgi:hypothetical protein